MDIRRVPLELDWLRCVLLAPLLVAPACASLHGAPTHQQLAERIRARTGADARMAAGEPGLPPGVVLADGLAEQEAVAIALWNNPAFQAQLADLGLARADLVQAGMLRNPVLILLLPWGPKQFEATLKWPIEALWQRPRRVAAARAGLEAVAERLEAAGLDLVAEARLAFVDLTIALQRAEVAVENADLARRISDGVGARFQSGDISELEAGIAEVDADRAQQDALRAALNVELARDRLHQALGLGTLVAARELRPAEAPERPVTCPDLVTLEREAFAWRPDLRGAELAIEAAAARLGWERSRIASFVAILDANAKGTEGFELGPGIEAEIPLDRNKAGVARARADLDRATAGYRVIQQRILRDLRDAYAVLAQSQQALASWKERIRPRLARQLEQTQGAYEAGELPYLAVVEASRRLNEGYSRELDARADMRHALVRLEQTVGRSCSATAP